MFDNKIRAMNKYFFKYVQETLAEVEIAYEKTTKTLQNSFLKNWIMENLIRPSMGPSEPEVNPEVECNFFVGNLYIFSILRF